MSLARVPCSCHFLSAKEVEQEHLEGAGRQGQARCKNKESWQQGVVTMCREGLLARAAVKVPPRHTALSTCEPTAWTGTRHHADIIKAGQVVRGEALLPAPMLATWDKAH